MDPRRERGLTDPAVPDLLKVMEAAAWLRVGRTSVYDMAHEYLDSDGASGMPTYGTSASWQLERVPELDLAPMIADMRPPSDDDVPIVLDGTPPDTPDKVIAFLNEINAARRLSPARAS